MFSGSGAPSWEALGFNEGGVGIGRQKYNHPPIAAFLLPVETGMAA